MSLTSYSGSEEFLPTTSKQLRLEEEKSDDDDKLDLLEDKNGPEDVVKNMDGCDTDTDTLEYSPDLDHVPEIDGHHSLFKIDTILISTADKENKPEKIVKTTEVDDNSHEKPALIKKITSVVKDAELITAIVDHVSVEDVYDKLRQRRQNPNRVNIVMDIILEADNKEGHVTSASTNQETKVTKVSILEDFVKVIDRAMANMTSLPCKAEEIHAMLEKEDDNPDRVDRVFTQLLAQQYRPKPVKISSQDNIAIMEDVRKVLEKIPGAIPAEVRRLLMAKPDKENRVAEVVRFLEERMVTSLTKRYSSASSIEDPVIKNDPLLRDMKVIKRILPDKDPNEIYAYLEAHYDKKNRIMTVLQELSKTTGDSQEENKSENTLKDLTKHMRLPQGISDEVDELKEIFPDCDPNYLYTELENRQDDKDKVRNLAAVMLEKGYPKLEDVLAEESKREKKTRFTRLVFNMKDFLTKFPDPVTTFHDSDKQFSKNYKDHAKVQIFNDFSHIQEEYLQSILDSHNYHFGSCRKAVNSQIRDLGVFAGQLFAPEERQLLSFPDEPDEIFFNEKLFLENEDRIEAHLDEQKRLKELRRGEARGNGEFLECGCCFEDECLIEDMLSCADGHLFCKECIRRSAEVVIGQSKCEFPCMEDDCDFQFPLTALQTVLPSNSFSILLRRMQEEEIKKADIPDLVSCPFCNFATIMSNPEDKIFRCLNPECLKDSCRLCGQPNHIPLRCEEIEKQGETDMRTYIETKVSEAMLRTCHRCKKRFVKDFGCNKMTCTCGASQCYVCRETDIDYDHFDKREECSLHDDANEIHLKEMEKAAEEARLQYIKDHPEAADTVLKYDPKEHIDDFKKTIGVNFAGPRLIHFNPPDEDEYDDSDMEY